MLLKLLHNTGSEESTSLVQILHNFKKWSVSLLHSIHSSACRSQGRGGSSGPSTVGTISPLMTLSRGSLKTGQGLSSSSAFYISLNIIWHFTDLTFSSQICYHLLGCPQAAVWGQEPKEGGQGDGGDRGNEEERAAGPEWSCSPGCSLVRPQIWFWVWFTRPGTHSFKRVDSTDPDGQSMLNWACLSGKTKERDRRCLLVHWGKSCFEYLVWQCVLHAAGLASLCLYLYRLLQPTAIRIYLPWHKPKESKHIKCSMI